MTRLIALCLSFVMALSAQHMAVARGLTHDVAGHVVLCTGDGVRIVHLDHKGDPVEVVHFCPECVLAASAVPEERGGLVFEVLHSDVLVHVPVVAAEIVVVPNRPSARAPPVLV